VPIALIAPGLVALLSFLRDVPIEP